MQEDEPDPPLGEVFSLTAIISRLEEGVCPFVPTCVHVCLPVYVHTCARVRVSYSMCLCACLHVYTCGDREGAWWPRAPCCSLGWGGHAVLGLHVAPWTMNGMLLQVEGAGRACVDGSTRTSVPGSRGVWEGWPRPGCLVMAACLGASGAQSLPQGLVPPAMLYCL